MRAFTSTSFSPILIINILNTSKETLKTMTHLTLIEKQKILLVQQCINLEVKSKIFVDALRLDYPKGQIRFLGVSIVGTFVTDLVTKWFENTVSHFGIKLATRRKEINEM